MRRFVIVIFFYLIILSLPYLLAWKSMGDSYQFGGFLLNPIDGNSYLAKMYQGYMGQWSFTLPYSAEQGHGVFLFEFYLLLGHVARLTGLSLLLVFHGARLVSSLLLAVSIYKLAEYLFPGDTTKIFMATLLALFGSGIGWILAPFGVMTSDFWVAEAFPFLSSYSNAHFPLGLCFVIWILLLAPKKGVIHSALLFLSGLLLAIVMPFGVVLCLAIISVDVIWKKSQKKGFSITPIILVLLGGGLCVGFQFWQTVSDPLLSIWNQQNRTPAPPLWDFIISFCPSILIFIFGILHALRTRNQLPPILLTLWFVLGIVLPYLPFSLQRRFLLGYYIPISFGAVWSLYTLFTNKKTIQRVLILTIFFSILTNVLLLFSGIGAISSKNPKLVLSSGEVQALEWIERETPGNSLVLASPEMGLFIPAYTGRRVIYGHPFETIHAVQEETLVQSFFAAQMSQNEAIKFLDARSIEYIIFGAREEELGYPPILGELPVVFQSENVAIYHIETLIKP